MTTTNAASTTLASILKLLNIVFWKYIGSTTLGNLWGTGNVIVALKKYLDKNIATPGPIKFIAIPETDPNYNMYKSIHDLPKHIFDELMPFLTVYKQLENKVVDVKELGDRKEAIKIIEESLELYKKEILKEE